MPKPRHAEEESGEGVIRRGPRTLERGRWAVFSFSFFLLLVIMVVMILIRVLVVVVLSSWGSLLFLGVGLLPFFSRCRESLGYIIAVVLCYS